LTAAGVARRIVHRGLAGLRHGRLDLTEGPATFSFGDREATLRARVDVRSPRAYAAALRGSTGWGEGYVAGDWHTDDLVSLTRIACRNLGGIDRMRARMQPLLGPLQRVAGLVPRNTRNAAAANISAHYDLGNDLFAAFLDRRMIYSSAVFDRPGLDLDDAQLAKLERVCDRLELGSSDHLVEIGTGWGGLAIHAAAQRGCRVTTTTISREQHARAGRLVAEAGLSDRVEVLLCDYRDLQGSYDKLVSVEMIEAVGWQYLEAFFDRCSRLLRPGGRMFLQAIVIADHLYEQEKAARSFANKHIFPGGCLPSQAVITELTRDAGMQTEWCEDISDDYALTLAAWRARFHDAWPQLRGHGYDERFHRLWDFYLATSEAGFRERRIRDLQFSFATHGARARRDGGASPTPNAHLEPRLVRA
jgi:cyclopropane-fatty-acyl-phospholipid synthase